MIDYCYDKPNLDWLNDELFFIYSYWEETSMFDQGARWNGVCYEVKLCVRVPRVFENCETSTQMFIDWMIDNYPDHPYFWVK